MKNTVRDINLKANKSPEKFVLESELEYLSEISGIADKISNDRRIKIVAIAGPSASGKTTSAHILCDKLKALGENTTVVSLDNFYLTPDKLPILPDGRTDIESVNALDIELMQKCFNEIIETGSTMLPLYDFKTNGRKLNAVKADITDGGIVIVEGLHALNPVITELVPKENIYKIYISVNCPILDDDGKRILSSRQIRLVRRTLRDRIFRGASVNDTLSLWSGVVEGETKYLYCFKDTADVHLKTLHLYEPCLYRREFTALKAELKSGGGFYDYFLKTADALEKFTPLESSFVPSDSLIREFIGGGKYN